MDNEQNSWTCTECGNTSSVRFPEDICSKCCMTYWKCAECGFTKVANAPPEVCPECGHEMQIYKHNLLYSGLG